MSEDDKVVSIDADAKMLDIVKKALKHAKDGELEAVAVVRVHKDGGVGFGWKSTEESFTLLGALTMLQKAICGEIDEKSA